MIATIEFFLTEPAYRAAVRRNIERKTGLIWGSYSANKPNIPSFFIGVSPERNSHVDFEVGLRGRGYYVSRAPK